MAHQHSEFVALIKQNIGHPVMSLHCIVYQENFCAKILNSALNDVMSTITKIVHFHVKHSVKTYRKFESLQEENKT